MTLKNSGTTGVLRQAITVGDPRTTPFGKLEATTLKGHNYILQKKDIPFKMEEFSDKQNKLEKFSSKISNLFLPQFK